MLATSNETTTPITFYLTDGILYSTEANGAPQALTSSRFEISNLSFANRAAEGMPGSVHVVFTIQRVNPTNKTSLRYSKTFYGTGTIQ
jgi:hypothetical protein